MTLDSTRQKTGVLVVDDEQMIRMVTTEMVASLGFDVCAAASAKEACEQLREHAGEISAVLLDMNMPGLTGAETLTRLRSLEPGLAMIVMSGYEIAPVDVAHDVYVLAKPFTLEQLQQVLLRATGSSS